MKVKINNYRVIIKVTKQNKTNKFINYNIESPKLNRKKLKHHKKNYICFKISIQILKWMEQDLGIWEIVLQWHVSRPVIPPVACWCDKLWQNIRQRSFETRGWIVVFEYL